MASTILLAGCLFQVPAVDALGVEGQIILGIFIPVTILVMTLCVGKACWTWYLTHGLDQWAYDPYLDLSLRTKYPAHTEPPASRGRIIRSCHSGLERVSCSGHQENFAFKTQSKTRDKTSIGPTMSSIALTTHTIGCAMAPGYRPLTGNATEQSISSPQAKGQFIHEVSSNSYEHSPRPDNSTSRDGTFESDLSNSINMPLHSSPCGNNSSVPLFHPTIGSPKAISTIEETKCALQAKKRPRNPYGIPGQISNREKRSTSSDQTPGEFDRLDVSIATNFPSFAFTGLEPRFSTFVRIKWAQFKKRFCRVRQGKIRIDLTSRGLQKDVKSNEEQTMFTVSSLRDQLFSSHVSPCGTEEVFELGPVTVPLGNINLSENVLPHLKPMPLKSLKHKQRRERVSRQMKRRSTFKFPSSSSKFCTSQGIQSSAIRESRKKKDENPREVAKRSAPEVLLVEQQESSLTVLKSASEATLSDDEVCNERYLANFDELFAKAEKCN